VRTCLQVAYCVGGDATPGENAERDRDGMRVMVTHPRVGLEIREFGQARRVDDLVGFADAQDRPPFAGSRVELIELEGDDGIASLRPACCRWPSEK
jgi:hypothetical protein